MARHLSPALLLALLVILLHAKIFTDDIPKPKENEALPEQAKRLGIDAPKKSMKFETIESKKYKGEKYDLVIDEEEAKNSGLTPEELKKSLKDAMDSRSDRREDSSVTIEIEEEKAKENSDGKNPEKTEKQECEKETKKKFVAKIKKAEKPENPHSDSKKPAEKKLSLGEKKSLKITAEGACESQNKGLLESVKFERTNIT